MFLFVMGIFFIMLVPFLGIEGHHTYGQRIIVRDMHERKAKMNEMASVLVQ